MVGCFHYIGDWDTGGWGQVMAALSPARVSAPMAPLRLNESAETTNTGRR